MVGQKKTLTVEELKQSVKDASFHIAPPEPLDFFKNSGYFAPLLIINIIIMIRESHNTRLEIALLAQKINISTHSLYYHLHKMIFFGLLKNVGSHYRPIYMATPELLSEEILESATKIINEYEEREKK